MRTIKYIIFLLLITACERQLSINIEDFEKKLVVNSFFAPGKPMVFYLSESTQILETPQLQSGIYSGKLIVLEDGAAIYEQLSAIDSGFLYTNLVPKAGSTYEILFDIDGFPLVYATDKVPEKTPQFFITQSIPLADNFNITFKIVDHPEPENYLLQAYLVGRTIVGNDSIWTQRAVAFSSNDKIFLSNISSVRSTTSFALFNDQLFSNGVRDIDINISKGHVYTDNFIPEQFVLQLNSLSETYFNYYLDILENNHIYGGPLATASFNAGNIEGGLGIFGAYNSQIDTVSVR